MTSLTLAIAQVRLPVGAMPNNAELIVSWIQRARAQSMDLIAFPELSLCGYPPEDLLYLPDFNTQVQQALRHVVPATQGITAIVGYPLLRDGQRYNAAAVIQNGAIIHTYCKQQLPNYGVFDERRYFTPGEQTLVFTLKGIAIGLLICEDGWVPAPALAAAQAGAELLVQINASPFSIHKRFERETTVRQRITDTGLPLVYIHGVGGQDEIIFDGGSFVMNAQGQVSHQAPYCEETLLPITFEHSQGQVAPQGSHHLPSATTEPTALLYQALVMSLRDYINRNHFPGVLLGLSGGIDSALTLALAVDAIGADRVTAWIMPSRYSASISVEDATTQACTLGVEHSVISIEPLVAAFTQTLAGANKALTGLAAENLQARCRGVLLMAESNRSHRLLLSTGNKSELAVGYCTLYGDMAGGFAPLKDLVKTQVYALARYRNQQQAIIPERVITRAPSAELRADQTDQDSLPPYEVLDRIIEGYVEQRLSREQLIAQGLDSSSVDQVLTLLAQSEYKRRKAAIGPKVTAVAFGKDWRMPICATWP